MGKIDDEIRVLENASRIIPHSKLRDRLKKAKDLKTKVENKRVE